MQDKLFGEWHATQEKLNIPRSSHLIIHAPISYFAECDEMN